MRPAIVSGLINGLTISTPVLIGVVMSQPAAGATACLGAYVTAFTNKGGPRGRRTVGLLVSAGVNTAAFGVGHLAASVWPVALLILTALVFAAAMGDTFGATVARCGTMPATAFLTGMGGTGIGDPAVAVILVAAGGVWYAGSTMVLTPAPRLRQTNVVIGQLYRDLARLFPDPAAHDPDARHTAAVASLRRAENAVAAWATPGWAEARAAEAETLVLTAGRLIDALAALNALGPPDAAVAREYTAVVDTLRARIDGVAHTLTRSWIRRPVAQDSGSESKDARAALAEFERVCDRLRENAGSGLTAYRQTAAAAQYRHRITAIAYDVDTAAAHAIDLCEQPNRPLVAASGNPAPRQWRRPHDIFTLTSNTYRHAVRTTVLVAVLFSVIEAASMPHGEWAVLAVLRVLRPQYGATTQRVWQRVLGNVIGGGCVAIALAATHSATILAVALFFIVTIGFALRPVNYTFWVIFGTPLILLILDLSTPGDWRDAVARMALTVVGSAVALVGFMVILPTWESDRLPGLLDNARTATATYLDTLLARLGEPTDGSVTSSRHAAEQSLIIAGEAFQRAQREPRHRPNQNTARILEVLRELNFRLDAVSAQQEPQSTPIPYLDDYRRHATQALRAASADDAAAHAAALDAVVDRLHEHLDELHRIRLGEIGAQPDSHTPTRTTIHNQQPTITQLARIGEAISALAARTGSPTARAGSRHGREDTGPTP